MVMIVKHIRRICRDDVACIGTATGSGVDRSIGGIGTTITTVTVVPNGVRAGSLGLGIELGEGCDGSQIVGPPIAPLDIDLVVLGPTKKLVTVL
jgi:hypothetical protein